ncbi:MAG TPA: fatty acid desaturase [Sorangium sp.]|nr:fatty acid desaturase [Sorangium sp.]
MGNPTVWLLLVALSTCMTGVVGYLCGQLDAVSTVAVNATGLYLSFTVLHDGVHGVVHEHRRVNRALATIAGFLLTFSFPFFRGVHMRHHRSANDPELDPDAVTSRLGGLVAPVLGGFAVYGSYHWFFYRHRLWRSRTELVEVLMCNAFYLGILVVSIVQGWVVDLAVLWILPLVAALFFLVYTFDYLPHRPHDSAARYYNARAFGGRILAASCLGQNYHLIHHLWPNIPWFRYRRVYLATAEDLRRRGCRIGWTIGPLPPGTARTGGRSRPTARQSNAR